MTIKAIDLCCGAGGWAAAARGLPIEWVAVADLASDCLETWAINHAAAHPGAKIVEGDLTQRKVANQIQRAAKGADLVCGAIPCEQVSQARANRPLKNGEMQAVHDLIDACFAIVRKLKPRWWVFEDVTAIEPCLPLPMFEGINYQCRQIQASEYGPQSRVRLFFGSFPELAPPVPGPRILAEVLRPGPYRTLRQLNKYERATSKWYGGDKIRVQEAARPGATVISSTGGKGSRAERSAMVAVDRRRLTTLNSRHETGGGIPHFFDSDPPFQWERSQPVGEPSYAIMGVHGDRGNSQIEHADGMVRIMEWQEAAALQGFPTDYVFASSWTRVWKMIGRAILEGVVKAAGRR